MHVELGACILLYFLTAWSLVLGPEWNPHSATKVTTSSSDSISPAPIRSHFPFSAVQLVSVPSLYFVFPSLSSRAPSLFSPPETMAEFCLVYLLWFLILLWLSTTFAYPRSGYWFTLVNGTPWVLCLGLMSGTRKPLSCCPPGLDCLLWIQVLISSRACYLLLELCPCYFIPLHFSKRHDCPRL